MAWRTWCRCSRIRAWSWPRRAQATPTTLDYLRGAPVPEDLDSVTFTAPRAELIRRAREYPEAGTHAPRHRLRRRPGAGGRGGGDSRRAGLPQRALRLRARCAPVSARLAAKPFAVFQGARRARPARDGGTLGSGVRAGVRVPPLAADAAGYARSSAPASWGTCASCGGTCHRMPLRPDARPPGARRRVPGRVLPLVRPLRPLPGRCPVPARRRLSAGPRPA